MPIYNDGLFEVFEIIEDDSVQANTSLQSKDISMTYQELGISDRLRSDLDSHDIDIQLKIDYENYVRKIIKLPMRPFNLNHSKQNKN